MSMLRDTGLAGDHRERDRSGTYLSHSSHPPPATHIARTSMAVQALPGTGQTSILHHISIIIIIIGCLCTPFSCQGQVEEVEVGWVCLEGTGKGQGGPGSLTCFPHIPACLPINAY